MTAHITPTMMVRLALLNLASAPRNRELSGLVRVSDKLSIFISPQDLALQISDWESENGIEPGFETKYIKPAMNVWADQMNVGTKLLPGREGNIHTIYEMFNGVGMLGRLDRLANDMLELKLQIFPRIDT